MTKILETINGRLFQNLNIYYFKLPNKSFFNFIHCDSIFKSTLSHQPRFLLRRLKSQTVAINKRAKLPTELTWIWTHQLQVQIVKHKVNTISICRKHQYAYHIIKSMIPLHNNLSTPCEQSDVRPNQKLWTWFSQYSTPRKLDTA